MVEVLGEESAKAIGKVADASGKAIDAGREFGGFFSRHFGGSVEQWAGLWEDKLRYRRWENQLALMLKAEQKIKSLGLEGRLRPLDMKIGIPLLEAASLENEESMRELWANLLVNTVNPNFHSPIRPVFIHALQHMTALDAQLLNGIYIRLSEAEEKSIKERGESSLRWEMVGIGLSATIGEENAKEVEAVDVEKRKPFLEEKIRRDFQENRKKIFSRGIAARILHSLSQANPEDIRLSLASLSSLGCISIDHQYHDQAGEYLRYGLTPLGEALIAAVSLEFSHGAH